MYDILKSKHLAAAPLNPAALLPPSALTTPVHSTIFDTLDGSTIRTAALRTSGAAGLSSIDTHGWRRFRSFFLSASDELCSALDILASGLSFVDYIC